MLAGGSHREEEVEDKEGGFQGEAEDEGQSTDGAICLRSGRKALPSSTHLSALRMAPSATEQSLHACRSLLPLAYLGKAGRSAGWHFLLHWSTLQRPPTPQAFASAVLSALFTAHLP